MTHYLNHLLLLFSKEKVSVDPLILKGYALDRSHASPFMPLAIVYVQTHDDVQRLVSFANQYHVNLVPRGAGTGKSGGCIPSSNSIVISFEKMNKIIEIDSINSVAVLEPGVILRTFKEKCEEVNLFYPPDPASISTCTIGGNVAVNAGGPSCLKYGVTKDYVVGLKGVYGNGESFSFGGKLRKNVAGLDLLSLMVGSEGILGCITEITVKLIPSPVSSCTKLISFVTTEEMMTYLETVRKTTPLPIAIEYFDYRCISAVQHAYPEVVGAFNVPQGTHYLLIEEECENASSTAEFWELRRLISSSLNKVCKEKVSEDITVPSSAIPDMLSFIESISIQGVSVLGYGHIGDGNLHVNVLNHTLSHHMWIATYPKLVESLMRKAVSLGGTITGEHGVGLTKKDFMPLMFSPIDLALMRVIKKACDPNGILNPGKVL